MSSIHDGCAYVNYEHKQGDGGSSLDMVGKVISAKKLLKESDCENERQRRFYRIHDLPCIYIVCRLADEAGHPGAVALAAALRDELRHDGKVQISYSVEGSTLAREGQKLTKTLIRGVALTYKPANKGVRTGIVSDPGAPPGFEKEPEKAAKKDETFSATRKFEAPDKMTLGRCDNVCTDFPSEDFAKTLSAGSTNAAPGSLSGGAALQVEDPALRRRWLVNQAKAALRDWPRDTDFKKFLKYRLPEADPDFIDHFASMVDDFRLKKAQAATRLKEPVLTAPSQHLTIAGKALQPRPQVESPSFDEKNGVLHTPRGSFPMYIPGRDPNPGHREAFHNIMADPQVGRIHDYAVKNWKKAHQLLAAGKLPPAVIMHATLFSNNSPNTNVPVQELMWGHLVDTMKEQGIDARDPRFATLKDKWLAHDRPDQYPSMSPEHWQRFDSRLRIKNDSKLTGRKAGELTGFMLANDKFTNMAEYHRMHEGLQDVVARHGVDAQAAVRELMHHKVERQLWDARRSRAEKAGKPDPGEYQGLHIKGLAPKTARYMMGMLGAGNVTVPDTHFIRYLFGLEKYKDTQSIDYLKNLLWGEGHADILDGIDRYYVKHHDAVQHMQAHPELKNLEAQHLAFPAFWRNWMAIVPHEKARGMRTFGDNEYTDHRPFWDVISKYLDEKPVQKAEQDLWVRAHETAKQHLHWQELLGEMPALILYYAELLPQLLGDSYEVHTGAPADSSPGLAAETAKWMSPGDFGHDPNGGAAATDSPPFNSLVRKFEAAAIEISRCGEALQKGAAAAKKPKSGAKAPPAGVVKFRGQSVKPGCLQFYHKQDGDSRSYAVLGHDDTHFHVVPVDNDSGHVKNFTPDQVQRVSKMMRGGAYAMTRWPQLLDSGKVVDAKLHGSPNLNTTEEQQQLIHGLDFGPKEQQRQGAQLGINSGASHWRKNAGGETIYLKGDVEPEAFSGVRREVAYHNLARDIFGLGSMVPTTAYVKHPQTGQELAAVQLVDGSHYGSSSDHRQQMQALHDSGDLHKAALMDWVLGNVDRHDGNWMVGNDGGLKLIDHGGAFNPYDSGTSLPGYLGLFTGSSPTMTPIHHQAQEWAQHLNPAKLVESMRGQKIPEAHIKAAAQRLSFLRTSADDATQHSRPMYLGEFYE